MPLGKKQCPKCETYIVAGRGKCDCGHVFKRKPRAAKKPSASLRNIESDEPEFAAGLTLDGRLMLVWPRIAESITLTEDEAALVLRALLAPGKQRATSLAAAGDVQC